MAEFYLVNSPLGQFPGTRPWITDLLTQSRTSFVCVRPTLDYISTCECFVPYLRTKRTFVHQHYAEIYLVSLLAPEKRHCCSGAISENNFSGLDAYCATRSWCLSGEPDGAVAHCLLGRIL
jgi:hypothetical protein